MKKIEDMTEEEIQAIIKLAEDLAELLQPYIDAFLYVTEALAKLLAEVQKAATKNYRSCKMCSFVGCYYLEKVDENTNTECCFCGQDKLEQLEACPTCQERSQIGEIKQ